MKFETFNIKSTIERQGFGYLIFNLRSKIEATTQIVIKTIRLQTAAVYSITTVISCIERAAVACLNSCTNVGRGAGIVERLTGPHCASDRDGVAEVGRRLRAPSAHWRLPFRPRPRPPRADTHAGTAHRSQSTGRRRRDTIVSHVPALTERCATAHALRSQHLKTVR